jgi:hypothetical protein
MLCCCPFVLAQTASAENRDPRTECSASKRTDDPNPGGFHFRSHSLPPRSLASSCGPFCAPLRSFCGPNPHEHPRISANTVPAAPSIFAAFRWYSRQFADLRKSGRPVQVYLNKRDSAFCVPFTSRGPLSCQASRLPRPDVYHPKRLYSDPYPAIARMPYPEGGRAGRARSV